MDFLLSIGEDVLADLLAAAALLFIGYFFIFSVPGYTPRAKFLYLLYESRFRVFRFWHKMPHLVLPARILAFWGDLSPTDVQVEYMADNPFGFPPSQFRLSVVQDPHQTLSRIGELNCNYLPTSQKFLLDKLSSIISARRFVDFFNGPVFRLDQYDASANKLYLRETGFLSYAITNYLLDKLSNEEKQRYLSETITTPLNESMRANNLAVHLNIVIEHGSHFYLLISQRSNRNFNFPGLWGHTAGGDIDKSDLQSGKLGVATAVVRELFEETGIYLDKESIRLNALFINCVQYQPILVATSIISTPRLSSLRLNEELSLFTFLRFDPQRLRFLFSTWNPNSWHPDSGPDLYCSLFSCFQAAEIQKAFPKVTWWTPAEQAPASNTHQRGR